MDEYNKENGEDIIEETAENITEESGENNTEMPAEDYESPETETQSGSSSDGLDKEYFAAPFVDEKEAATIKASKRTTVVLISIILVLVAVIVVFVALFLKEYQKNSKQNGSEGGFFSTISSQNRSDFL